MVLLGVGAVFSCVEIVLGGVVDGRLEGAGPEVEWVVFGLGIPVAADEPCRCS